MEQGEGSRIRRKIRIDVIRCCCDVKHELTPSELIHKFLSTHQNISDSGRINTSHTNFKYKYYKFYSNFICTRFYKTIKQYVCFNRRHTHTLIRPLAIARFSACHGTTFTMSDKCIGGGII